MSTRATFFGIEIGKTGLYVSQKGLDVTGHNIANVDTLGYTRQRLTNTAYDPYNGLSMLKPVDNALVGGGAKIQILEQIRSAFLDRQFRTEQTAYSYWGTRTQGLSYVESLFESTSGELALTEAVNDLFSAFNTVSGESADQQQRTYLRQQAIKLTEQLNHMHTALSDLQTGQNSAVKTVTDQINTIAEQIASLNKSIYTFELDGAPANDLRDKRNLLVDQLSALVDVEYSGDAIGSKFELKVAGETLVKHTRFNALAVREVENVLGPDAEPVWEVYWAGNDPLTDPALDLTKLTGGELLSHIDLRDGNDQNNVGIPYFINELNALAQSLVQSINAVHREGWTHPAGEGTSNTGYNFFYEEVVLDTSKPIYDPNDSTTIIGYEPMDDPNKPIYDPSDGTTVIGYEPLYTVANVTAGNIRISDELAASVYNIAASTVQVQLNGTDENLIQVGNNLNMLDIFALYSKPDVQLEIDGLPTRGIGSFNGLISSITMDVATTLERSKHKTDTSQTLLLSADTQRTSIAGVSLDEEMTNLLRYNHAYSGASRVINAMDEALDVLINKTGLVGRG